MHTQAHKPSANKGEAAPLNTSAHQESAFSDNRAGTQALKEVLAMRYTRAQAKPFEATLPQQHEASLETDTGLPGGLMAGIENLSGISMSAVQVHYNSAKPAQLQAHAYTQGTDIHLGPGQEKHLPHEAWHVVQQQQRRVKPTLQTKSGVFINDDNRLEKEADVMGTRAMQWKGDQAESVLQKKDLETGNTGIAVAQCFSFPGNVPDAKEFRDKMGMKPDTSAGEPKGQTDKKDSAESRPATQEYKQESTDLKDKPEASAVVKALDKPIETTKTPASAGLTITTAGAGKSESKEETPNVITAPLESRGKMAQVTPEGFLMNICDRLSPYHDVRKKITACFNKWENAQANEDQTADQETMRKDVSTIMRLNDELEHEAYGYMVSNASVLYLKAPSKASQKGVSEESKAKSPTDEEIALSEKNRNTMHDLLTELQKDHVVIIGTSLSGNIDLYVAPGTDQSGRITVQLLWKKITKDFGDGIVRITRGSGVKVTDENFTIFKKYVLAMFAKLLTRPEGQDLIQQLIVCGREILIELGAQAATSEPTSAFHGVNLGGAVMLSLGDLPASYKNTTPGKGGRLPFPAFVTLGHELVHLLHQWQNLVDKTTYKDPELRKRFTNPEEKATIDHENKIRAEHGLGTRTSHAFSEDDPPGSNCCVSCVIQ